MVPVRTIAESLGAEVTWEAKTKTGTIVTLKEQVILRVGDTEAFHGDRTITLDVPAKVINGRTMVPLRFVSESLGA